MTIFAKREMTFPDWVTIQDRIEALQLASGAPHDLMMFSSKSDDRQADEIYLGLPDRSHLASFPGFIEIRREDLPDYLTTLVVREDGFVEMFPEIAKKRRVKIG